MIAAMRRWILLAVGVLAVALLVAGGLIWTNRRDTSAAPVEPAATVQSVAVVRTDLSVTESLTGTLGYGPAAPVKGAKDGVITWLPAVGASIGRGEQLFRANDLPVVLFYGGLPLYRDLTERGTVGRDVRVVADNLRALGYAIGRQPAPGETVTRTIRPAPADPGAPADRAASGDAAGSAAPAGAPPPAARTVRATVRSGDGVLTKGLIAAVKRWQRDAGVEQTGRIGMGDVVVLSGAVRIDSVTAQRGDSAATPLVTVTTTAKVITATADVAEAGTIRKGEKVTVLLPGGKTARGRVTGVGTVVREDEASGEPKRSVTVAVDDPKALRGIDAAKVQIDLAGETRSDVLAVPVGALVALSEGGYAVQEAGTDQLLAVETGMFAKGLVEVTGDGLAEDMRVVTTS